MSLRESICKKACRNSGSALIADNLKNRKQVPGSLTFSSITCFSVDRARVSASSRVISWHKGHFRMWANATQRLPNYQAKSRLSRTKMSDLLCCNAPEETSQHPQIQIQSPWRHTARRSLRGLCGNYRVQQENFVSLQLELIILRSRPYRLPKLRHKRMQSLSTYDCPEILSQ
jgi:hypothetical protein